MVNVNCTSVIQNHTNVLKIDNSQRSIKILQNEYKKAKAA